MNHYSAPHLTNIIVHVAAGTVALILGIFAITTKKGGKQHARSGNLFLLFLIVVILTGLVGVFVFKRNTFLLIITTLSGYYGFSGYRILQRKTNTPAVPDVLVAIISLASVGYFLYYFLSLGMYWSPVIVYSTIGALVLIVSYDFLRYLIPSKSYGTLWLYEHIFKMIGAFTALLSAFTGTVFPEYQPYSQFLPSVFGTLLQIGFIVYYLRQKRIQSSLR